MPVKVLGLDSVPQAGDLLEVVEDEKAARAAMEDKERQGALARTASAAVTLEAVSSEIAAGKVKALTVVLKTDVHGSQEAIAASLEKLRSDAVQVRMIHSSTGNISESDVMLALASQAVVIGFNVRSEPGARRLAENEGVEIRHYAIIYELIEDLEKALQGLLEPVTTEVVDGKAEVRALFRVRGGRIAGCYVKEGNVNRGSPCRLIRGGQVLHTSRISSLRRFQEDVREVQAGYECGAGVEGFEDFQEGDIIETFHQERTTAAGAKTSRPARQSRPSAASANR